MVSITIAYTIYIEYLWKIGYLTTASSSSIAHLKRDSTTVITCILIYKYIHYIFSTLDGGYTVGNERKLIQYSSCNTDIYDVLCYPQYFLFFSFLILRFTIFIWKSKSEKKNLMEKNSNENLDSFVFMDLFIEKLTNLLLDMQNTLCVYKTMKTFFTN